MYCTLEDCNNKLSRRGLCQKHYKQDRLDRMALGERAKPGPQRDPNKPYSKYRPRKRKRATETHCANGHAFEVVGYYVAKAGTKQCRVCRNNSQRRLEGRPETDVVGVPNKEKTHCPEGHEYAGDNLYVHPTTGARRCLTCHAKTTKEWRLKNLYDLSFNQYEAMLEDQDNACKICAKSFDELPPVVDHDHATGAVRGLLCTNCNTGLGQFLDSVESLENAISYLKSFSETSTG
jgi:hypothetical protein